MEENLLESLEKIGTHLVLWQRAHHTKDYTKIDKALWKDGCLYLPPKRKKILREYIKIIRYYEGKFVAYMYVLQELHGGRYTINKEKYPYFYEAAKMLDFL